MYAALIFLLVAIFSSSGLVLAVPSESVAQPNFHQDNSITAGAVSGPPAAKVPDSAVQMFIRQGSDSRFELFFIDVRYGYDLVDFEFYKAWCLAKNKPMRRNAIHKIRLYNCYDPNLPPGLSGMGWNQINYIVNHKKGSKEAIQEAIWYFANSEILPTTFREEAVQLIEEAKLKGKDYKPAEGEILAVICQPDEKKQPVFIEYKIPEAAPLDVASSSVAAPAVLASGSSAFPAWLSLLPLIPIIPIIGSPGPDPPPGPNPPPNPPPPVPPAVPEPSSLLLLVSAIAVILMSRTVRKRIKRPSR